MLMSPKREDDGDVKRARPARRVVATIAAAGLAVAGLAYLSRVAFVVLFPLAGSEQSNSQLAGATDRPQAASDRVKPAEAPSARPGPVEFDVRGLCRQLADCGRENKGSAPAGPRGETTEKSLGLGR